MTYIRKTFLIRNKLIKVDRSFYFIIRKIKTFKKLFIKDKSN